MGPLSALLVVGSAALTGLQGLQSRFNASPVAIRNPASTLRHFCVSMATNLGLICQSWPASPPFETNHVSAEKVRNTHEERTLWSQSSPPSVYSRSLLAPIVSPPATKSGFWTDCWQDCLRSALWGPFVKNNAECPTGGRRSDSGASQMLTLNVIIVVCSQFTPVGKC